MLSFIPISGFVHSQGHASDISTIYHLSFSLLFSFVFLLLFLRGDNFNNKNSSIYDGRGLKHIALGTGTITSITGT